MSECILKIHSEHNCLNAFVDQLLFLNDWSPPVDDSNPLVMMIQQGFFDVVDFEAKYFEGVCD